MNEQFKRDTSRVGTDLSRPVGNQQCSQGLRNVSNDRKHGRWGRGRDKSVPTKTPNQDSDVELSDV